MAHVEGSKARGYYDENIVTIKKQDEENNSNIAVYTNDNSLSWKSREKLKCSSFVMNSNV